MSWIAGRRLCHSPRRTSVPWSVPWATSGMPSTARNPRCSGRSTKRYGWRRCTTLRLASSRSPSVQHMWLKLVSEGGLEPVERPLDERVSDILSAKMDPGGPGCTPLLRIGALQERTKVAPDNDPGTKVSPGCLTRAHWSWGLSSATSLWIHIAEHGSTRRGAGEVLTTPVVSSVFRPSSSAVFRAVRSIGDEVRAAGAMRGDDEGLGPECRDPDSG